MKYYLIAGEASGDLHASRLMHSLKQQDSEAQFRFFGGDLMATEGGEMVKDYRELAYMGFVPVLLHLPAILRNMKLCKEDIARWQPDVVILVDYPGFNLNIAKFVHGLQKKGDRLQTAGRLAEPMVCYYIAPKIWAWKEYRIKRIKRDIDMLLSILPFEVDFFEKKHHYPIHYVGNPTAQEVRDFKAQQPPADKPSKKIIALLAGSRRQEIKDNLPAMIEATRHLAADYRIVLAAAPSIAPDYYTRFVGSSGIEIVYNQTYQLLSQSHAALVTSGTATLETALFGVPQVVCYYTPMPWLSGYIRRMMIKVKYVSLVNLIADHEIVRELVADTFSVSNIRRELNAILDGSARERMLEGYKEVSRILGDGNAPDNAARIIVENLMG